MFSLVVKNAANKTLNLTDNPNYFTVAEGFNALTSNINTTASAVGHGSVFNSSKLANRNITLQIILRGDIEASRLALYEFFSPLFKITFYYQNEHRRVHINGYVESFECNPNVSNETANISVICNEPFLLDDCPDIQELSNIKDCFKFPCSVPKEGVPFGEVKVNSETVIINKGEHEVGCIIVLWAKGSISAPLKITNLLNGQFFELNTDMSVDDVIIIKTSVKQKSAKLYRDRYETNLFSQITDSSSWLQLYPGENILSVNSSLSLLSVDINITPEYIGV